MIFSVTRSSLATLYRLLKRMSTRSASVSLPHWDKMHFPKKGICPSFNPFCDFMTVPQNASRQSVHALGNVCRNTMLNPSGGDILLIPRWLFPLDQRSDLLHLLGEILHIRVPGAEIHLSKTALLGVEVNNAGNLIDRA